MDGFTYRLIPTEREGNVTHAARDFGVWQVFGDVLTAVNKVHSVIVVLFDAGGHSENVRVEDNIFWREAHFVDENAVRTLTDFVFALFGVGLACFIERHDNNGGAISLAAFGFLDEFLFTFFKRDGVHDSFTLNALQASFDDFPLR